MRKRIVAFMLSAAMIFSCTPMQLHAEELNSMEVVEFVDEAQTVESIEGTEEGEIVEENATEAEAAVEEATTVDDSAVDANIQ